MNIRLAQTCSPCRTLALLDMAVSSPSSRVYRNGRQQVEVTVRLRALDANGARVELSDAERDSIRLVHYESGRPLSDVPCSGEVTQGWGATRVRNMYSFFPERDVRAVRAADVRGSDESIVWYVQTVDTRPMRIGCQVRRDDGVLSAFSGEGAAPFVELWPERLPTQDFARSVEYRCERESAFPQGASACPSREVDYYYFSVYTGDKRLAILSFDVNPASLLRCEGDQAVGATFCFTGYAAPGAMSVRYALPSAFDAHRHRIVTRPRAGEGIVVRVCGDDASGQCTGRLPWQSCDIDAIDEFGTAHALRISFDDAPSRNTLVCSPR